MEYFFKRLEAYVEVRPTAAMTDIIVKIMVEVLSILGIVTKEIWQGRMSIYFPVNICAKIDLHIAKYLKKLVGRRDVEDALQRLDQLTQEEARMAASELLKITRGIDSKVEGVDKRVQVLHSKVGGVDDQVRSVDGRVGLVIKGIYFPLNCLPNPSSQFHPVRRNGDWSSDSTSVQSSQQHKLGVIAYQYRHHHRSSRRLLQ
jgi:hypothetical protein